MFAPALEPALSAALARQSALDAHLERLAEDGELEPPPPHVHAELREARDAAALRLGRAILAELRREARAPLGAQSPGAPRQGAPPDPEEPLGAERAPLTAGNPVPLPVPLPPPAPPPPAPPPPAPPPPASEQALAGLRDRFNGGGAPPVPGKAAPAPPPPHPAPPTTRAEPDTSAPLVSQLAQLPPLARPQDRRDEAATLDRFSRRLDELAPLSAPSQRAALGMFVTRARRLQTASSATLDVDAVFRRLSAWADAQRPGWVHGLAREHTPRTGTWDGDARAALGDLRAAVHPGARGPDAVLQHLRADLLAGTIDDEELPRRFEAVVQSGIASSNELLLELAEPHLDLLTRANACKTLRKRLRERRDRSDREEGLASPTAGGTIAPAALALTRGRNAVVVGGDERGTALTRITQAFQFASLSWERGWNTRRVQALRDRISSGSIGCVIYLRRYLNHSLTDVLVPAADGAGALQVWVDQGYGVGAIERAVLRTIGA